MKTSKKLTLLGLGAATALAASAGAVSSFAWFATNGSVTADNMIIKAESTNAFLEIKNATDAWNADASNVKASSKIGTKIIKPTSLVKSFENKTGESNVATAYSDGDATHKWISATASKVDDGAATSDFVDVTAAAEATEGNSNLYTLISDFDLRLRYTAGMTVDNYSLSASVSWSDGSGTGALANSVRAFMVIGDIGKETVAVEESTKGFIFSNSTGEWTAAKSLTEGFVANSDQKGTRVRVFVYFDGQDSSCTTLNAIADSSYSLTLTFSVSKK